MTTFIGPPQQQSVDIRGTRYEATRGKFTVDNPAHVARIMEVIKESGGQAIEVSKIGAMSRTSETNLCDKCLMNNWDYVRVCPRCGTILKE